jgi:choline dehydrogenase-like flavoprotein
MSGAFTDANSLAANARTLKPEVCVIGSGAGGAVTAQVLANAGRDVLVVEEGGHRTRKDFNMREDVAFRTLYEEGGARTTKDTSIAILQGRTVGGTTVVNWTTCFRTPDVVLDHWKNKFGVSAFSAAELNPHWDEVEKRLSIAEIALDLSNRNNRLLYDGCKALGFEAAPTRRNVKSCMRSGYCGMGCPVDAKQSMLLTYLPDAVAKGATVLYRCRIDRLELSGNQVVRARGSILGEDGYTPTGNEVVIEAKKFIISAGAINSPAILLRSGLGGADSPLGRRTFLHPTVGVVGRHKDPVEAYYGAPQSIASHAFADRFGADAAGIFLEAAPVHPVLFSLSLPGFGDEHRQIMTEMPRSTAHISLAIDGFGEGETGGTVEIRPSGAPLVDYVIPERIWRAVKKGLETLAKIDLAAGADLVRTGHDPPIEIRSTADLKKLDSARYEPGRLSVFSAHVMGGCAMGSDPKRAVVRSEDLRHHTVENLHVIDGSVLPTALGVNPQETIYGLAHLTATRLHAAWH